MRDLYSDEEPPSAFGILASGMAFFIIRTHPQFTKIHIADIDTALLAKKMGDTPTESDKMLRMKFHGRIIDQLGSQTYQSPVASIAELIANAWDADAHTVNVWLPGSNVDDAEVVVEDDGHGLSFQECEDRYLNIGFCKRGKEGMAHTMEGRAVLGRKGIGKFSGFGMAGIIHVDTVSKQTGEKTSFEMNLDEITGDEYMEKGGLLNAKCLGSDEARKEKHGTKITLKKLMTKRNISKSQFPKSMARRFLLHATADNFKILIDGKLMPEEEDLAGVEFSFPKDYRENEMPDKLRRDGNVGEETLPDGRTIRWKVHFYQEPISEPELQGITVFANHKLAQQPFMFNCMVDLGDSMDRHTFQVMWLQITWISYP